MVTDLVWPSGIFSQCGLGYPSLSNILADFYGEVFTVKIRFGSLADIQQLLPRNPRNFCNEKSLQRNYRNDTTGYPDWQACS
jgi:hypothetical protein